MEGYFQFLGDVVFYVIFPTMLAFGLVGCTFWLVYVFLKDVTKRS